MTNYLPSHGKRKYNPNKKTKLIPKMDFFLWFESRKRPTTNRAKDFLTFKQELSERGVDLKNMYSILNYVRESYS